MKKNIFILFALFYTTISFAQSITKGWEANFEAGANLLILTNGSASTTTWSGDIFIGGGYNFDSHFYLGLETGSIVSHGPFALTNGSDERTAVIPVLADFRYSFKPFHKKWTPFLGLRAGYGIVTNSTFSGYALFNPRGGIMYSINKHIDLHAAIGYLGMWNKSNDNFAYTYYNNLNGLTGQIGIGYHF